MTSYVYRPQAFLVAFAITALPAALATAALVLLMHLLIATDMSPPEIRERGTIDFISQAPELTVQPPTERPDRPPEVAPEPRRIVPKVAHATNDMETPWSGNAFTPIKVNGPITSGTNMVVPYLKLQPEYPSRALSRGIEGYVDLAFDITAAGATSNIRVIDAQPEGVFERAAIRALEKWKYKVPITDGTPQGQVDMMTRLTFQLED